MPKEHPVYIRCHYTCQQFYHWVKGYWPCPRGSNFLCVNVFPIVKLRQGNFQGDVKKNKRIFHDSSWGKFCGLIRTQRGSTINQSWENEMYQTVEITCYFLIPASSFWQNPTCNTGLKVRQQNTILSTAVNIFTFNRFKNTLRHQQDSFISVGKNSFLKKIDGTNLWLVSNNFSQNSTRTE